MRKFLSVLLVSASLIALGQDPEFSQYYAAPLYLNPAFTGTTNDHRFIINYRNQWPSVAQGYTTTAFSYDYNVAEFNSGFGFLATQDQAGTAGMKSTQFNFLYSYKWRVSSTWVISSGLNFGYASRNIDFNKLLFADQLQIGVNSTVPTGDPSLNNAGSAHYFDFKGGLLAYNRNFWFGFAASHVNEPNRSLINQYAYVPMKVTVHGGVRIPLYQGIKKTRIPVLSPSFVYKHQANFEQLDVGAYLLYDPIIFGLWYRGIPVSKNAENRPSQDAAVVMLGYQIGNFEIVYSYDFTVSALGPASGGAHELALKYHHPIPEKHKSKKREKFLPCPSFNRKE
ncbi:MAG TPA: type IX secretion system membrane protein PorP/SprF [Cyclobacteriaceae bacterium]|jgi:type IX secretion system PorP/SprF family membrane protein|nr:type IX secretion system membrane protein PorP/SprF [Cyclobacteriaceae bacterium]